MNKMQWEYIVERITQFNRLAHTDEERKTESYYVKSCNVLEEEYENEFKPWYAKYKEEDSKDSLIEVADGIADTIVTGVQVAEINSPSSLNWEYIELLRSSGVYTKYKDIFISPIADVLDKGEDLGLDVFTITKEVCDSNMTKMPTLDQVMQYYGDDGVGLHEGSVDEACNAAADYIACNLGYEFNITWKIRLDCNNVERVVFFNDWGKVMKPWCYKAPQIGDLV